MAVFTELSLPAAAHAAAAHGLPTPDRVVPVPAGSVNSNFFIFSGEQRWFLRIYEEQDVDGVAYEWDLLTHLRAAGVPVPMRQQGPGPGALRVAGKPVAIFEAVGGGETCQAGVSAQRAQAVGAALAGAHRACDDFPRRREGRFTMHDIASRLEHAAQHARPELSTPLSDLRTALEEARAVRTVRAGPSGTATGVIHGDLFRDNVRFDGDRIVALLDWESASDGDRMYDLAVTLLAWCYGDTFDWKLAAALVAGYQTVRTIPQRESSTLRDEAVLAAVRFSATRITDYHLREDGIGEWVSKDYRRFLDRLKLFHSMSGDAVCQKLSLL